MNAAVTNDMYFDQERSIWIAASANRFSYSDGRRNERYLANTLRSCTDLSSSSTELESKIIDWPTEYHLSPQRAFLLREFDFDRSARVLEVGCGCGAITRFLGGTFDSVLAVEGSPERAAIARLRTRDQSNVSVLCGRFDELCFRERFDLAFCIGVLEYAGAYSDSEDPFGAMLLSLRNSLGNEGTLVLAIENQFGLKYFCGSPEDHTGRSFDGIEGYWQAGGARTFGYTELKAMLGRHFASVEFFFPYPDYKVPTCILSEEVLSKVDVSGIIAAHARREGEPGRRRLFDEVSALRELARNAAIPFFANSFLVVAANGPPLVKRNWLGVMDSNNRRPEFRTTTRIVESGGAISSIKSVKSGTHEPNLGGLSLRPQTSPWMDGPSISNMVSSGLRGRAGSLAEVLAPTVQWYSALHASSWDDGGIRVIDGKYLDAGWSNSFVTLQGVTFIDLEWHWAEPIRLSYVVLRALLYECTTREGCGNALAALGYRSLLSLVRAVCEFYGLPLTNDDIRHFIVFEAHMKKVIRGMRHSEATIRAAILWRMVNRPGHSEFGRLLPWLRRRLRRALRAAYRGA